jgi:peptidoglycan/xylan/chitin deacetylase (PgdA/CDA1 family)
MYHRVAVESFDPWGLAVSVENFAEQMRWLRENRSVLQLSQFAKLHASGTLGSNAVAITFDDGYLSTATSAAPVLEEHDLPATIFLPADLIEQGRPFWWDELQRIVLGSTGESLHVDDQQINLGQKTETDADWRPFAEPKTARQRAFHRIWALLRHKPPAELKVAMGQLHAQSADARWHDLDPPMTPDDVRAIASERLEFGSHALTHPWLPGLSSEDKVAEIFQSVDRCRSLTGRTPQTFAYPYGARDTQSEALVRQAGFTCACATDERPITPQSDSYALPRIGVGNWSGRQLGARIAAL